MRKVSKKSVAIFSLSVLLVISILLTFTYAAITAQQKEINGTITISAGLEIVITEGTDENGITFEADGQGINVTFGQEAFEYDGANFVLTAAARTTLEDATISINATGTTTYYYKTTFTEPESANINMVVDTAAFTGNSTSPTTSTNLSDLITTLEVTDSVSTENTFTITFDASYANINA